MRSPLPPGTKCKSSLNLPSTLLLNVSKRSQRAPTLRIRYEFCVLFGSCDALTASQFIFLAGGFGASPWIFQEVGREIAAQGLRLSRPDTQTCVFILPKFRSIYVWTRSKAVADGAISYYLDKFVVSRIVRYTYGTPASIRYDPSDPEHRGRSHKKHLGIVGGMRLDVFSPTLFKVDVFVFGSRNRN